MSDRQVILKNTTGSEITILGWIIPVGDELDASNISLAKLREDDTLESLLVSGDIVVNDGTYDYPHPWGTDYLDNDLTRSPTLFGDVNIVNPNGGSPTINIVSTDTDAGISIVPQGTGTLNVAGTTDYEDLVVDDDDIPNKLYVDTRPKWLQFDADVGTTTANTATDILTITGGTNVTTSITGDTLTIDASGAPDQDLWETFTADTGSTTANTTTDTLNIIGGIGVSTSITGDTLTITNDNPNVDQNIWLTIDGDTGSIDANTTADTLTVAGGTGISTAVSGDTLTVTNTSPNVDQNLFLNITDGTNTAVADSTTDTLTIAAGAGLTSTVNPATDTVTIGMDVSGGASAVGAMMRVEFAGNGSFSNKWLDVGSDGLTTNSVWAIMAMPSRLIATTFANSDTGVDCDIEVYRFAEGAAPSTRTIIYTMQVRNSRVVRDNDVNVVFNLGDRYAAYVQKVGNSSPSDVSFGMYFIVTAEGTGTDSDNTSGDVATL